MTETAAAIFTYFEADHDRLDAYLRDFQKLKRTEYAKAKPYFREFKFGLMRHIIWEEEILFPLFEQRMGITEGGPTEVMRLEHELIKQRLDDVHEFVRHSNPDSDEAEQALMSVLFAHNQKEEMILYPAIDRLVTEDDVKAIFAAMEAVPEERYRVCCGKHQH